jgi:hypothetical protein
MYPFCFQGGAEDIKQHRWFDGFDWEGLFTRRMRAPFVPEVRHNIIHFHLFHHTLSVVLWLLSPAAVGHGGVRIKRALVELDLLARAGGGTGLCCIFFMVARPLPDSVLRLCFSVSCRCVARRTRTTSTSTPTQRKRRRSRATRKGIPSSTSRSLSRFLEASTPERPWPVPAADRRAGRQLARGEGGRDGGYRPPLPTGAFRQAVRREARED